VELGPGGPDARAVARRAAERLAAAGRRAATRGDLRAAVSLLGRAAELFPPDEPERLRILPVLARTLHARGDWEHARTVIAEALERSKAAGDRRAEAEATVGFA